MYTIDLRTEYCALTGREEYNMCPTWFNKDMIDLNIDFVISHDNPLNNTLMFRFRHNITNEIYEIRFIIEEYINSLNVLGLYGFWKDLKDDVCKNLLTNYKKEVEGDVKMDKLLKFIEKNDIKYVRDNSVFPGKYDYLFFKSGSNTLIEFHNLSNSEISRVEYQDIIIKKLEKAYVCKYYNY